MQNETPKNIIIAIDGFSACGKSTLARHLAESLGYIFIDSGAMYRAVTLYALNEGIPIENVGNHLDEIKLAFILVDGVSTIFMNQRNVALEIRSDEVNQQVSHVAKIPTVRRFLVSQQRKFGEEKGIVMDGRDIGTVVFPHAELKFFVEADIDTRTRRRASEMAEIGKSMPDELIRKNLRERDHIDSTRADSPLRKAEDAIAIDNSNLSKKEQLELCLQYVEAIRLTAKP